MNGKKAKALRRLAESKATDKVFKWNDHKVAGGKLINIGLRATYKLLKKHYKAGGKRYA